MTNVDSALMELEQARAVLVPIVEGLHDFARLNLNDETHEQVRWMIETYERRLNHVLDSIRALTELNADGYPVDQVLAVAPSIFEDLAANVLTIQAAYGKFRALNEAAGGSVLFGDPQPK